jgi:hypothetical protein
MKNNPISRTVIYVYLLVHPKLFKYYLNYSTLSHSAKTL